MPRIDPLVLPGFEGLFKKPEKELATDGAPGKRFFDTAALPDAARDQTVVKPAYLAIICTKEASMMIELLTMLTFGQRTNVNEKVHIVTINGEKIIERMRLLWAHVDQILSDDSALKEEPIAEDIEEEEEENEA